MKIRIAQWGDLEALVEIYNQAIMQGQKTADTEPMSTRSRAQWFADHTPDQYPLLVAQQASGVVGYASISAYRPGRQAVRFTAEISYYVHVEHHRQGIASDLLRYALDIAPACHLKTLFAILVETNEASIRLLEKFGFERWGYLPNVADYAGVEVGHLYYGLRLD